MPFAPPVLERAAALYFQSDPVRSTVTFDETDLEAVVSGSTTVYQTTEDDGGCRIVDASVSYESTTIDAAMSLCYCLATAGKYAFEASGTQEADVHQRMSAQYVILAG